MLSEFIWHTETFIFNIFVLNINEQNVEIRKKILRATFGEHLSLGVNRTIINHMKSLSTIVPDDIWRVIFKFVDPLTLGTLSQVCSSFLR